MPRFSDNLLGETMGQPAPQPMPNMPMGGPAPSPMPNMPMGGPGGGMSNPAKAEGAFLGQNIPPQPIAPMGGPRGGPSQANKTSDENQTMAATIQPPQPIAPMGGPGGMVAGTALTPAIPSPSGGGSGALPTASMGGPPMLSMGGPGGQPMGGPPANASMGGPPPNVPMGGPRGMSLDGQPARPTGGPMGGPQDVDMGDPAGGFMGGPPPNMPMGGPGGRGDLGAIKGGPGQVTPSGAPTGEYDTPTPTSGGMALTSPTSQSLLGATSGGDIASQFGFDASQYGGYFTPISEAMKKAGTEAGYAGMLGERRAQLRQQTGEQRQGLRASLLQDVMMSQQQGGASGFAGGGAQQQALGLARTGRQLGADQLASQYGRGMYGVRQQIAGRVVAGQQALSTAQQSMYDRALALQRSGASMSGAGTGAGGGTAGGAGSVLDMASPTPQQVDVAASTGIDSQIAAQGGIPSDPTMAGNVISGVGQGAGTYADADDQVTGQAYDDLIAQLQQGQTTTTTPLVDTAATRPIGVRKGGTFRGRKG